MVKKLLHFIYDILAAVNAFMLFAMWVCGFATTFSPADYPSLSYIGMVFPAFLVVNVVFLFFWLIFRRKVLLLSLLGMLPSYSYIRTFWPLNFDQDVPEGCIKLLSYNTQYFGGLPIDSVNEVVRYINDNDFDIVCLMESSVDDSKAAELFGVRFPYSESVTLTVNHTIMLSRYPILEYERINYPSETNMSVAFTLDVEGDTLIVIANHFESYKLSEEDKTEYKTMVRHPKEDANRLRFDDLTGKLKSASMIRAAQVDSVYAYIERHQDRKIVCCGDFNEPSLSYSHYRLTRMLNDAYTDTGSGPGISYNRSGMYFRIDNILVSPDIAAYGAKVDAYSTVSDHFPIFSYLKIGGN